MQSLPWGQRPSPPASVQTPCARSGLPSSPPALGRRARVVWVPGAPKPRRPLPPALSRGRLCAIHSTRPSPHHRGGLLLSCREPTWTRPRPVLQGGGSWLRAWLSSRARQSPGPDTANLQRSPMHTTPRQQGGSRAPMPIQVGENISYALAAEFATLLSWGRRFKSGLAGLFT